MNTTKYVYRALILIIHQIYNYTNSTVHIFKFCTDTSEFLKGQCYNIFHPFLVTTMRNWPITNRLKWIRKVVQFHEDTHEKRASVYSLTTRTNSQQQQLRRNNNDYADIDAKFWRPFAGKTRWNKILVCTTFERIVHCTVHCTAYLSLSLTLFS